MKFEIRAVSNEEYAKADADLSYYPREYVVCEIEAETDRAANLTLKKGIKEGIYPKSSCLIEVD
jgi:hypothetical protein